MCKSSLQDLDQYIKANEEARRKAAQELVDQRARDAAMQAATGVHVIRPSPAVEPGRFIRKAAPVWTPPGPVRDHRRRHH